MAVLRDLDECKAEVFRRSQKRIEKRRTLRNRALMLCVPLCLAVVMCLAYPLRGGHGQGAQAAAGGAVSGGAWETANQTPGEKAGSLGTLDSFSFSLTWGCNGVSSYDSETGRLVKTTDATHPEDYVTTYFLTEEEKERIYSDLSGLDLTAYPDRYDPNEGLSSAPSMTLILSVRTDTVRKTITAEEIACTYESADPAGQKFLTVCKSIEDILTGSEAWQALPEYEFIYQ